MTFVILTGGIDLSVGSVVALSTLLCADARRSSGLAAVPRVRRRARSIGADARPRRWAASSTTSRSSRSSSRSPGCSSPAGSATRSPPTSISITDPSFSRLGAAHALRFPASSSSPPAASSRSSSSRSASYVLHYTRLGRNVYAIGGNEQSALLMGLPVARTKIAVYTISGFCSALGGILLSLLHAVGLRQRSRSGMELDAIAAVVIGGTLLTGGSGYLVGSVLGVLVLGLIQTLISFDGTLSSWWTKIVIGLLLFAFILLQRAVFARRRRRTTAHASAR